VLFACLFLETIFDTEQEKKHVISVSEADERIEVKRSPQSKSRRERNHP
jgi:hypothetical protein